MSIIKTIEQATGMTATQIAEVRRALPISPLKRYVEYELEKTQYDRVIASKPKTEAEVNFENGVREGLDIAKGILNRPPTR